MGRRRSGARTSRVERSYFRGHVGPPKSAHGRRGLRLSEELARALWEHRQQTHVSDSDLIFTGPTSSWLHAGHVADVFKAAAVAAEVPWLGFHGFRHTCATALFNEGGNVKQAQRWLGHHSPAFTLETYVHLLTEDLPKPPSFAQSIPTTVRDFATPMRHRRAET